MSIDSKRNTEAPEQNETMSAFGGILFFDRDRTADRSVIDILERSLECSGRDGSYVQLAGSAAFVYRPFHTTAESRREQQPVVDGELILTFDGRIDNRDELADMLNLSAGADADLFSCCYKVWRNRCFSRIVGDFSAAIWNARSNELTLVRDPFGVRKLFYFEDRERIIWSTDIHALLNFPGVPDAIDERFVAMSLSFVPEGTLTPFKYIKPISPGHFIVFNNGKSSSTLFWDIYACHTKRTNNLQLLEEELRHLLSQSISACLRSDRVVMAELSGGLDSSTIVCIANDLLKPPNRSVSELITLSHVYDQARQSDERDFIKVIEDHIGRQGFHIKEDDRPILSYWPDPNFISYPNRVLCFGGAVDGVHAVMKANNSRVLLSGFFGDQLFVSSHSLPYDAVDLAREGDCFGAIRTCRTWCERTRQPFLHVAWHAMLRPLLPYWMRRLRIKTDDKPAINPAFFSMPSWLDHDLVRRTQLLERVHRLLDMDARLHAGSTGIRFANLMLAVGWFGSGYNQNRTMNECIEMRYPYLYRPLVEFLLSLPYRMHCNEEMPRVLQRAAIKGIVPEPVRTRWIKRGPHEAVLLAVRREKETLLSLVETSRACELGFVIRAELQKEMDRWRNGQSKSDLLKFVAVEMWLRALEIRRKELRESGGMR